MLTAPGCRCCSPLRPHIPRAGETGGCALAEDVQSPRVGVSPNCLEQRMPGRDPLQLLRLVTFTAEKPLASPKLHVLAVGVNDYWDSRLRLSYAVPDAEALGEALRRGGCRALRRG